MVKILALAMVLTLILPGGRFAAPASAASPTSESVNETSTATGPLDFDTCARLAIRQSPFLTKSDLEIQVRRLDETDSKADFIPSVNFRTRYYLSDLSQTGSGASPYSVEFISDPYSPVDAYFSLQARKLITRLAVLNHLKVIADSLHRLGRLFLEMEALGQMSQLQIELVQLAEKNLVYAQERQKIGAADALDLQVAAQELEVAKLGQRQLAAGQKKNQESLKAFLAWPAHQDLRCDLTSSRQQVLGRFHNLAEAGEVLPDASYEVKMQSVKQDLQKYNIVLAKTKLLPTLFMGVQTPDPLSSVQSRSLFFFVGANIPVWDGFKRIRNVSRQKTILRQQNAEMNEKEIDFKEKWREAQEQAAESATQLKMAQSRLELALLKRKQHEMRFHSLGEPLTVYLEGEKGVSEARKNVILKTLDYDLAKLNLRQLANDLLPRYVNEHSLPRRLNEKY